MKQYIIIFFTLLATSFVAAQTGSSRLDAVRAKKADYIKQQLNLTPAEAKAFWPVYNEYEKARWEIMKRSHDNQRSIRNGSADYAEMADRLINDDMSKAQLAKTYHERFKKILPPDKLFKYYAADRSFKDVLLKDIKRQAQKERK